MRNPLSWINVVCLAFALSVLPPQTSRAHEWPSRPITLVAPFPPGSPADFVARAIAQDLTHRLGQPVIVENKAGSGGSIALTAVARAAPDGYTLLVTGIGPAIQRPLIDKNLSYDTFRDFAPIVLSSDTPNVLLTGAQSKFKTLHDVIAYAKANPGKLTIGHPGIGTMGHFVALLFAAEAKIDAIFIAYKGPPAIISDVVGGRIDLGSIAYGGSSKAAKVLAVTTNESVSFLPGVPTMNQLRLSKATGATWHAVFAPAGTSAKIIAKLNTAINVFLAKAETKKQFEKLGFRVVGGSAEELKQQMLDDRSKWSNVIAKAHLNLNR